MNEKEKLEAWVTTARRQRYEASSREHEASFARVQGQLDRRRGWYWLALGPLALAVFFMLRPLEPISYRVQRWDGEQAVRMLTFSDGTNIALAHGSALDVTAVDEHGAVLRLRTGHASLAVTPRPGATWVVQAGPYRVRVTGTAFELDWSDTTQRFAIAMQHGSVLVSGPHIAGGEVALRDRESLTVGEPEVKVAVEAPAKVEAPIVRPKRVPSVTEHDWAQRIASGEFAAVLQEAERAGISQVLAHATIEDLSALADAARYARQTELARRALLALRRRFPSASQDSAFLLGRLMEGEAALRWYERYLVEQPNGVYAAQALGRAMVLQHEAGDLASAAGSAARYLEREPSGPYATTARALVTRAPR